MKLLVFASGRGSNFEAMVNASKSGCLNSKIVGLLCDKDCTAAEKAKMNSIPVTIVKPKNFEDKSKYIKALINAVDSYNPDYILLAGYMRILPSELIDLYPLKIINVHPSLLPAYAGKNSIQRTWDAKEKVTGITVHFVNDKLDQGPMLAQESLIVPDSLEQLEEEMHKVEHRIYPDTVKKLTENPFDTAVVSRCLLGVNCRYDGGNKYSKRVETYIKNFKGKVVDICPEIEAGFGVPRPTADIVDGRAIMSGVGDITDKITEASERFANLLSDSKNIVAILKERSPSCGKVNPRGIFTSYLINRFRDKIFVVSEEDL